MTDDALFLYFIYFKIDFVLECSINGSILRFKLESMTKFCDSVQKTEMQIIQMISSFDFGGG